MSIKVTKPKFKKTLAFLEKRSKFDAFKALDSAGKAGVRALSSATPVDSGDTARSWNYKIVGNKERYVLIWTNSEMAGRAPLALMLQYGHNTKSGYFLSGRDYINPALRPVYDDLKNKVRQEVF